MDWDALKDAWWLIGVLSVIIAAVWRLAIQANKSKERLDQVAQNEKNIVALQREMTDIKEDLSDIKAGMSRQGADNTAVLSALQSIMTALNDSGCKIGPARDKLNEHLAKR
ncbi:MAG: hypothetical protein GX540_04200 [Clostridiales bacterium]|nr:hypothetical protein [Clostridiales bacterium]